jgi:NTP pyrophosphatase (non-canonical NTP hydrolase)
MMALKDIAQRCWQIAEAKGFHEVNNTPPAWVANLHGEVSELWEAYRNGKLDEPCDKGIPLTNAEEELADIVIRAFDTAGQLGFDIERAILVKLEYNASRPYLHGGKKA